MFEEQEFHAPSGIPSRPSETGRSHPGLVDDHEVTRIEQVGQLVEPMVAEVTSVEKTRVVPGLDGGLRNRLLGQVVDEVGDLQRRVP
jgi:hypothetical protein